jgi:hypothetical protein
MRLQRDPVACLNYHSCPNIYSGIWEAQIYCKMQTYYSTLNPKKFPRENKFGEDRPQNHKVPEPKNIVDIGRVHSYGFIIRHPEEILCRPQGFSPKCGASPPHLQPQPHPLQHHQHLLCMQYHLSSPRWL